MYNFLVEKCYHLCQTGWAKHGLRWARDNAVRSWFRGLSFILDLDSHDKSRLRYGFLLRRFSLWLIKITATLSCLNCSRIVMSHFFFFPWMTISLCIKCECGYRKWIGLLTAAISLFIYRLPQMMLGTSLKPPSILEETTLPDSMLLIL